MCFSKQRIWGFEEELAVYTGNLELLLWLMVIGKKYYEHMCKE